LASKKKKTAKKSAKKRITPKRAKHAKVKKASKIKAVKRIKIKARISTKKRPNVAIKKKAGLKLARTNFAKKFVRIGNYRISNTMKKRSIKATKRNGKKVIKKVKSALAVGPLSKKRKKEELLRKTKKKLHTKKEAKVKEAKKTEDLFALSPEDIKAVSEILSRPIIRELLVDVGGENAIAIIRNFEKSTSDEDIAKNLKIKISDVRASLNKLNNEGFVLYNRYKDSETGWYSYSWYLDKIRMERWAEGHTKKFEGANHGSNEEFYVCPFCGVSTILGFEAATDKGFKCDICNKPLEFLDEEKMQRLGIIQTRTFVRVSK
jgi:transcription factor E